MFLSNSCQSELLLVLASDIRTCEGTRADEPRRARGERAGDFNHEMSDNRVDTGM